MASSTYPSRLAGDFMKKALLIVMMLLLPWQAATAAQRNLVHLLSSSGGVAFVVNHIAEHEANVPHHHHDHDHDDNDDGGDGAVPASGTHHDDSAKSLQHLSDYEHGGNLYLLLQAPAPLLMPRVTDVPPVFTGIAYLDRTTLPPLRPPCFPA
jgi:hypothetical protein